MNSATNCLPVCAMNCAARFPAVMNSGRRGIKLGGQAKQVAVERPAQTFIRADQDHRTFADFAHLQQRMGEIIGA